MTPEYPSELQFTTWRFFLKTYASITSRIDADLLAAGRLSISAYDMLSELYDASGHQLSRNELIKRVLMNRRGVTRRADHLELTRLADQLETEGLMTRNSSGMKCQEGCVEITEQGVIELRCAWPIYAQGVVLYFAQWMDKIQREHFEDCLVLMLRSSFTEIEDFEE